MRDRCAGVGRHALQRADLVGDHVFEVARAHIDATTSEAPEVVEPGMNSDADTLFLRARHQVMHRIGIARMEPAGDAGGGDDVEKRIVVADLKYTETLAHIGVQVDLIGHRSLLVVCSAIVAAAYLRPTIFVSSRSTDMVSSYRR